MMKMSGRVTSCCVALFFALTSVTAVQRLNSIDDLKKINFGKDVPKHSLVLLYWFANIVDIDVNDDIQLTFDPNRGDYGSHYYGNFEGMLDPLPWGHGYRYYTIGNLNQETSMPLPSYVVRPEREYMGRNMDRIIICVWEQNAGWEALPRIDEVYITQHRQNQRTYDPEHTYQITTDLLRQIREFSVGQDQQQLLRLRNRYGSNADVPHIMNTWGDLACLGLLLFIVIQESHKQHNNGPEHSYRPADYNEPHMNHRPEDDYRPQSNDRPEYDYRPQSNDRPEDDNRPQSNDRPEDDNRPQSNDRPEDDNRPQSNDRPEDDYRPQSNDRPEDDNRPQSNDTPEDDYRPQSNDRPEDDNRPQSNDRPEDDYRPQSNDRPEDDNRPQSNDRPEDDNRPQSNDRPEDDNRPQSNDRPKDDYRPQSSYISENRHRDWNDDGGFVACWVVVFVLLCFVYYILDLVIGIESS